MVRRVFQITKSGVGGGGVYAARLNSALKDAEISSRMLSIDNGGLVPRTGPLGSVEVAGDRIISGACHRRSTAPFHSFFRVLEWQTGPDTFDSADIIHLHSITGFIGARGLKVLLKARPKVFWTAHNPWMFTGGCVAYAGCERFTTGCLRCPILKFPVAGMARFELRAKRRWIKDFDVRPIANSQWMAAMMRRSPVFAATEEIPIVPPIVEGIFSSPADRYSLRRSLGLTDDRFVVGLSASSLTDPGKGIVEFFRFLPQGAKWLNRVTFLLIGDGRIGVPAGVVAQFTGRISETEMLRGLYGACDFFISPSFMETFGMAILEAQACGAPVIAFSTGGTPEAVFPGQPCVLVENRNFDMLYEAIEAVVADGPIEDNVRHELTEWVTERHGPAAIAAHQIAIYKRLVR